MELWVVNLSEAYRAHSDPVMAVFDTEEAAVACATRLTTHDGNARGYEGFRRYYFSLQRCTVNREPPPSDAFPPERPPEIEIMVE